MSNPFATFRKNQTYWMAALVLIAILSFIIAPAIDMVTKSFRGGGSDNRIIAKWDGGRITQDEIEITLGKRVQLRNFLTSLAKKVIAAGGSPAVPGFLQFNGQIFSLGVNDNLSSETVAMTKIMLTQAQKMGVEFDDLAADEFLKEFCNNKISDAEFNEILKTSGLKIFEVRELIKQDLTTTTAEELAMGGRRSPSPAKLWQNFLKLNQTAKLEVYAVPTSAYLDKVTAKPTEAQLQELYEEGKNRAANPESPEAGFVRLDQANIEYVESNYTTWFEKEKAKITDEELKAEYDKQIAAGLLKVPVDYKAPSVKAAEEASSQTTDPAATPAPTTDNTPSKEPAAAPAGELPANPNPAAAPSASPENTPAVPPAGTPESPAGTPAAPTEPAAKTEPAPTGDAPSPSGDVPPADVPAGNLQSSKVKNVNDVQLVSFVQQESTTTTTQETPAPSAPTEPTVAPATGAAQENLNPAEKTPAATPEAAAVPAQDTTTPATATPATTTPATATPATATPATTTPATVTPPATAPAGESDIAVAEPGKPAAPPTRDMTFEEAREQLLQRLADTRASKISGESLNKLQTLMRDFYLANRQYQSLKNAEVATRKMEPPVRPDLKKFAEENGLKYGETGMGDRVSLAASQFGGSVVLDGNQGMGLVAEVAPMAQIELFAPLHSQYQGRDAYFLYHFWKTEAKPAFVPQLSEIRDQVEDAWRRIESRKFAEEAAQALLKKVGASEDPWAGALSSTERTLVASTPPFTWLSRLGSEIRMTSVTNLDRVGDDFMKQVFNTEVGKFGVASNNPKTVYYLFRVLEKGPEIAELQNRFTNDPIRQGPNQIANNEMRAATNNWRNKVIQELNVQFP